MLLRFKSLFILILLAAAPVVAQDQSSILRDTNGDGVVSYLGFGDSITFGVGDTEYPTGGGYVLRLGQLLGIQAINKGVPGEELLAAGVYRFPEVVAATSADVVSVMEGTNDAVKRADSLLMRHAYQRTINIARARGKEILLMTLPSPTAEHAATGPFTDSYSYISADVAKVNDIRLVDFRRAWLTTCVDRVECELYNLPEGLHPNGQGYVVMAQTLAAAILGIDIFAADGAGNLEAALGLEPGTVIVKPEVSTPVAPPAAN